MVQLNLSYIMIIQLEHANPCDVANNSASAAFARYSGNTYKSEFNANYNDNAYVGFKYGTTRCK